MQHHRDNDGEVDVCDEEALDADSSGPLRFRFSWRRLWRFTGPAWLMSLAYLDPGNLEGDLQQGAYTGVRLVWVLWWATVMGLLLQEMSARIAIVTGRDLAQLVREHYPRWLNYTIYAMMEIAVIGSDIQEVVGSAIALNLLSNQAIPVWAGCIITGLDTLTFLAVQVRRIRCMEGLDQPHLFFSLLAVPSQSSPDESSERDHPPPSSPHPSCRSSPSPPGAGHPLPRGPDLPLHRCHVCLLHPQLGPRAAHRGPAAGGVGGASDAGLGGHAGGRHHWGGHHAAQSVPALGTRAVATVTARVATGAARRNLVLQDRVGWCAAPPFSSPPPKPQFS